MRDSPLLGRTAESATLWDACGLGDATGGLVVLSGEAGIGKTRLLGDLAERARAEGHLVVVGHCVGQSGAAMPYLPIVELLASLRVQAPVVVSEAHPALEHLDPGRDEPGLAASPAAIAEAVHACLTRVAAERQLLAIIEDVHWADHSSRDLITLLLSRGFASPVALVVSYRSDDLHRRHPLHDTLPLWARTAATRLDLGPLGDVAMRELIGSLDASADAASISRRAEGNPFFAQELVATGPGLGDDLGRVLRTRFERLEPDAQLVIQAVAVDGPVVAHDLLASVVALPPRALDSALRAAIEHHSLETVDPDAYRFRHALLGEAVAADLLPGERIRLHRAFAMALAEDPGAAAASEVAWHAAAAGDLPMAIEAGRRAAESAMRRGGPREALDLFESVLGWLPEADPGMDDVTVSAAEAAAATGDITRAVNLVRDRLEHGSPVGVGRARLLAALVVHERLHDRPADHVELASQAVALARGANGPVRLETLTALAQAHVDAENWPEAAASGEDALALAEELRDGNAVTDLRTILSRVFEAAQDAPSTEAHLRSILADSVDGPAKVRGLHRLADIEQDRGSLREALDRFDEAAAIGRRTGRVWGPFELMAVMRGAVLAYELGEFDAALGRLDAVGGDGPQPLASLLDAARVQISYARDGSLDGSRFDMTRRWWERDVFIAVLCFQAAALATAQEGRLQAAIAIVEQVRREVERQWCADDAAMVRVAAVMVEILADAISAAGPSDRARYLELARDYGELAAGAAPWGGHPMGPEGRAWAARLAAEQLRLQRVAGGPVSDGDLLGSWRDVVERFAEHGHVYETGRARARLAHLLAETGEVAAGRSVAEEVRRVAQDLPSRHLLGLIGEVVQRGERAASVLTPREAEILLLVARGASNGEIGRSLFISTKTVSVHVSNILAKLGARNRAEAAALARHRGLLGEG